MKCPQCGRDNRSGAGFCAWCGGRLPIERGAAPQGAEADARAEPSPSAVTVPTTPATTPTTTAPLPAEPGPAAAPATASAGEAQVHVPEVAAAGGAPGSAPAPETPTESVPPEGEAQPIVLDEGSTATGLEPTAAPSAEGTRSPGDVSPLAVGSVVAGRYEIVELIESSPDHNRYRARDLVRCANCGSEENAPDDAYCANCGASLQPSPFAEVLEQMHIPPADYQVHFAEGQRDYYVTVEPLAPAPEAEPEVDAEPPIRLVWGLATDQGQKRDHNEDYMEGWLYTRGSGGLIALFVVADGLGGQDSGEVASRMATDAVWASLRDSVWQPVIQGQEIEPDVLEDRVVEAARAANRVVYQERTTRGSEMSTTLTMALVSGATAYIANVGDSRTYVWNAGGLQRITRDHSLVQRLVDAGQIAPEEVYTHPQRNLIYQSIGDRPDVKVDSFRRQLAVDDRLILCSDGLWEMVHEDGLEEVLLSEPDPQRASDRLVQNANLAGGEDNITVIIVQARRA